MTRDKGEANDNPCDSINNISPTLTLRETYFYVDPTISSFGAIGGRCTSMYVELLHPIRK